MGLEAVAGVLLLAGVGVRLAAALVLLDAVTILVPVNVALGEAWWELLAARGGPAAALLLLGGGRYGLRRPRDRRPA